MNGTKNMKWEKEKIIDTVIFSLLLLIYTAIMYTLFYRQVFGNPSYYHSDMKAYILEMQGLDSGYSFPYPIFFKLGAFLHLFIKSPELSVAVAITILNSLSVLLLKHYMTQYMKTAMAQYNAHKQILINIGISVLAITIFFVSMLFPPKGIYLPGINNYYVGVFSPNPLHNATYMATRPFAIITFFLFGKIAAEYEKQINWKDNLTFAVFLLLTTMTKPSFTFVLVPTAGLVMAYRLIKNKFKTIIPALQLGICFLPTFAALLYQFVGVFHPGQSGETGIGFGIATAWKLHCNNILLAIGVALGFPILVLLLNFKELRKDPLYLFSWQLMTVSFLEVFFLYEKGFRLPDMNFSWGYMHGIFFAFAASLLVLIKSTLKRSTNKILLSAQWLAYLWHLACGLWYFKGIFMGSLYY